MKSLQTIAITIIGTVISACSTMGPPVQITTESGYTTQGQSYLPAKDKQPAKDIVFIAVHGKSGNPDAAHQTLLYNKLNAAGYEVLALRMPWSSDWDGTFTDAMQVMDRAAAEIHRRGKKALIIGHSMGGAGALHYASRQPKNIMGIVTVAPGHMLHRSNRMQSVTESSVEKAKAMIEAGKGDSKAGFKELNTGKVVSRTMSARVYLSYYDLDEFPDIEQNWDKIKLPVFWVAGAQDRLTALYDMESLFVKLPENRHNKYMEIKGGHKEVLANAAQEIIDWAEGLQ